MELQPRLFRPADAERITGVSQPTQRAWRDRGYMPRHMGMARLPLAALAELWAYGLLAARGIGPERARRVAGSIGLRIAAHAERLPEAFAIDVADPSRYCASFPSGGLARYFVWFPSEIVAFGDSLDGLMAGRGLFGWAGGVLPGNAAEPHAPGALIALDLEALARELLSRSGPLFTIDRPRRSARAPSAKRRTTRAAAGTSLPVPTPSRADKEHPHA